MVRKVEPREWLWRFGQRHRECPGDPSFGDRRWHPVGAVWWRRVGHRKWRRVPGKPDYPAPPEAAGKCYLVGLVAIFGSPYDRGAGVNVSRGTLEKGSEVFRTLRQAGVAIWERRLNEYGEKYGVYSVLTEWDDCLADGEDGTRRTVCDLPVFYAW